MQERQTQSEVVQLIRENGTAHLDHSKLVSRAKDAKIPFDLIFRGDRVEQTHNGFAVPRQFAQSRALRVHSARCIQTTACHAS